MALGHFLDGKVTSVVGTHTHVPTSDSKILKMEQLIKPILECVVIMTLLLE